MPAHADRLRMLYKPPQDLFEVGGAELDIIVEECDKVAIEQLQSDVALPRKSRPRFHHLHGFSKGCQVASASDDKDAVWGDGLCSYRCKAASEIVDPVARADR